MAAEEFAISQQFDELKLSPKEESLETETEVTKQTNTNKSSTTITQDTIASSEAAKKEEDDDDDDDDGEDILGDEDDLMEPFDDDDDIAKEEAEDESKDSPRSPSPPPDEIATKNTSASSPSHGCSASPDLPAEDGSIYHVKWVHFNAKQLPILTQNANGPCPLIAIANVLLLRQAIQLPQKAEVVTSQQIVQLFGDRLLSADFKSLTNEQIANFQQNMDDAFNLFPKLQTGLDMNLRFSGVRDFEYTRELGIFDLFEIPIFHGWLVDPQEEELAGIVRNCSYNQLVEKIINEKADDSQEKVRRALLAEQFLELTASQLTYHGLCELNGTIKEGQLGVLFRNNHFNTLIKFKDALYILVTDQGFLHESHVVWETLNDIDGDSGFLDSAFRPYQKPEPSAELPAVNPEFVNTPAQVDSDYQLALSLSNEVPATEGRTEGMPASTESDYALAKRLQQQEDSMAAADVQRDGQQGPGPAARVPRSASQPGPNSTAHQRQRTVSQTRGRSNGDSCGIL